MIRIIIIYMNGFVIYMISLIKGLKDLFKIKNNDKILLIKYSIILGIVISLLVGHTLVAPGVSIYLIYLLKYREE